MLIQISGQLFEDVQKAQIFKDQKSFVDSIPKDDPNKILKLYKVKKKEKNFNLKKFINQYFVLPNLIKPVTIGKTSLMKYIDYAWTYLERKDDLIEKNSTRINLPFPYIVPGGRFGELYYWDSFFSALGLVKQKKFSMFLNMVKNYAFLIDSFGFIPNGTRKYFLTRSQPPVFALYIDLLEDIQGFDVAQPFYEKLEKEYEFWMNRESQIKVGYDFEHLVRIDYNTTLNRYYDKGTSPREESFLHDYALGSKMDIAKAKKLYSDLRSGSESGWDFSTRWFRDQKSLETISTTDILPIDLNCLIYFMEQKLAFFYKEIDNDTKYTLFKNRALRRKNDILKFFWSEKEGFFFDYYWTDEKLSNSWTIAGVFPLFVKIASKKQAHQVAVNIEEKFLKKGGVLTTLIESGQQWDAPNGWAPLQWITVKGLENYGYENLSEKIKKYFVDTVISSFKDKGALFEKYNMIEAKSFAKGGEYENQIGFGWTNGVILDFMN